MTLREELMLLFEMYVELNRENAHYQVKDTADGAQQAVVYMLRADAAETLAFQVGMILQRHGQ